MPQEINTQTWLQDNFPTFESKKAVKFLRIGRIDGWRGHFSNWTVHDQVILAGTLDLKDFINLVKLHIVSNKEEKHEAYDTPQKITKLKLDQCKKLQEIYLENGQLEGLDVAKNTRLTRLEIHDQKQLTSLVGLGKSITALKLTKCFQLEPIRIENCFELNDLYIQDCNIRPIRQFKEIKGDLEEVRRKIIWLKENHKNYLNSRQATIHQEITLLRKALGISPSMEEVD